MAFDPEGGSSAQWASLPPALLVLPELLIARSGDRTLITICATAGGDLDPTSIRATASARLSSLRAATPLPPLDPDPRRRGRGQERPASS